MDNNNDIYNNNFQTPNNGVAGGVPQQPVQPTPVINNADNTNSLNRIAGINNTTEPVTSTVSPQPMQQPVQPQPIQTTTVNTNQTYSNYQQPNMGSNNIDDEELLKAFIGEKYDKITTHGFNIPAFFFKSLYLFYRRMFGYGILVFIVSFAIANIFSNFFVNILFGVVVGFIVNKLYVSFAINKVAKIKANNPGKSGEELKRICYAKGGTSGGLLIGGLILETFIIFVTAIVMLIAGVAGFINKYINIEEWLKVVNIEIKDSDNSNKENNNSGSKENNTPVSTKDSKLLEDVKFVGSTCMNKNCTVSTMENNKMVEYDLDVKNKDLLPALMNYSKYIKLDIYYVDGTKNRTIVDYKLYLKDTNEDITNSVTNEDKLREKIGLYTKGKHTDTFTINDDMPGSGYENGKSYSYTIYKVVNSKGDEYKMRSVDNKVVLEIGKKYSITFEMVEDGFGYDCDIISAK